MVDRKTDSQPVLRLVGVAISMSLFLVIILCIYYCCKEDTPSIPEKCSISASSSLRREIGRRLDEAVGSPIYGEVGSTQPACLPNYTNSTLDGARTSEVINQPDNEQASSSQTQRQVDEAVPPPSYKEVVGTHPAFQTNSTNRTSDGTRTSIEVQPDSEKASSSRTQKGKSSKPSDVKKSKTTGTSKRKFVPGEENMCDLYVDKIESTEKNKSQTIITYFESGGKSNEKGKTFKQPETGKEQNIEKDDSETGSTDQYCSAEDVSYGDKYDTGSGGK